MEFPTTFANGITVLAVENPQWATAEHIEINADVTFILSEGADPVKLPYTSCPFDTFGPHCPAIFEHCATLQPAEYERPAVTVDLLQAELDAIWPDVVLGLADEATLQLAKNLRVQIKAMS
ncbi:tail fiber protein [Pseudomonas phage Henninger]|uniref:Uncharacterized protein n=1 Tax=Pseudomonas phage Henninger TaxID=2079287 RepID=A0A2K9VH65_9CAUD|nr:tail fiber protein [Pseudomonas phage Henninger]AUV61701.1 hypothetical protein PsPhHenninger_gp46 [Pseudomonas phage Henninger]